MTKQLVLTVGYDIENINDKERRHSTGAKSRLTDMEEKFLNMRAGTENLEKYTSSSKKIVRLFYRYLTVL